MSESMKLKSSPKPLGSQKTVSQSSSNEKKVESQKTDKSKESNEVKKTELEKSSFAPKDGDEKKVEEKLNPKDSGDVKKLESRAGKKTREDLKQNILMGSLGSRSKTEVKPRKPKDHGDELGLPSMKMDEFKKELDALSSKKEVKNEVPKIEVESPDGQVTEPNRPTEDGYKIGGKDYVNKKLLGSGKFGSVYKLESEDGQKYAMKDPSNDDGKQLMDHEIKLHKKVGKHDNVVEYKGKIDRPDRTSMLQEFVEGGDLKTNIRKLRGLRSQGKISEGEFVGTVQYLSKGVLKGLDHLESKNIVHSDIKGDNILLDKNTLQPKITDLGLAQVKEGKLKGGTPGFMAPEVQDKDKGANPKSDIWAVGQEVFKTKHGEYFSNKDNPTDKGIRKPNRELQNRINQFGKDGNTDAIRDFSEKELKENQELRNKGLKRHRKQVQDNDPKVRGKLPVKTTGRKGLDTAYTDFMNKVLTPNPKERLSAKEALNHPFLKDPMISDDQAKGVLKKLYEKPTAKKTEKKPEPQQEQWTKEDPKVTNFDKVKMAFGKKPVSNKRVKQVQQDAMEKSLEGQNLTDKDRKKQINKGVKERKKKHGNLMKELKKSKGQEGLTHVPEWNKNDRSAPNLNMYKEDSDKKVEDRKKLVDESDKKQPQHKKVMDEIRGQKSKLKKVSKEEIKDRSAPNLDMYDEQAKELKTGKYKED